MKILKRKMPDEFADYARISEGSFEFWNTPEDDKLVEEMLSNMQTIEHKKWNFLTLASILHGLLDVVLVNPTMWSLCGV